MQANALCVYCAVCSIFLAMFSTQTPFCIFQKQDRVTIAQGRILHLYLLDELPTHAGTLPIHSISMIPYCQIKERGFKAIDGGAAGDHTHVIGPSLEAFKGPARLRYDSLPTADPTSGDLLE